jgi:hypothetical protein
LSSCGTSHFLHRNLFPVFLFVVDSAISERELSHLKGVLISTITSLPLDVLVGIITFDSFINVRELKVNDFPHSFLFSANKTYTALAFRKC